MSTVHITPSTKLTRLKQWLFGSTTRKVLSTVVGFLLVTGIPTAVFYWNIITPYFTTESKFRILVPLETRYTDYIKFVQNGDRLDPKNLDSRASKNINTAIDKALTQWKLDYPQDAQKISADLDFFFFPEGSASDKEVAKKAFSKALEISKTENRQIIALIGNISSTSTQTYGEFCAEKQIPMILPLATATDLLHSLRNVPAVLRLPPSNEKQADLIARFLLEKAVVDNGKRNAIRTLLVKDLSNKVYSDDLINVFRSLYVQNPLKQFADEKNANGSSTKQFGRIIGTIPIGIDATNPFLDTHISNPEADALVLFSMTDPALETLAQVQATKIKFPYIILTDGAVDQYLLERIGGVIPKEDLPNIYLTFPLSCPMPSELDDLMGNTGYKDGLDLTHSIYVADSAYIALNLVKNGFIANEQADLKGYLIKTIKEWSAKGSIEVPVYKNRRYTTDSSGNCALYPYHLFQIKVTTGKNGEVIPRWEHAKMCPATVHSEKKPEPTCINYP
jgi:hypothetical protein